MPKPILIAGPTASGKSRLALDLARRLGGIVVNADSMQVYAELRILTARPSAEDEVVPHRLYGHVSAAERYSAGRWLADIAEVLAKAERTGIRPVIVGGTGLYFRALTRGLTNVPTIPAAIRSAWRERATTLSAAELHGLLAERAPAEAMRVRPSDPTRILRALEVIDATGRTLPEWHAEAAGTALVRPDAAERIVVAPPREALYQGIDSRFRAMIDAGALDEARRIAELRLDSELPAMKALGLRPLLAHLRGEIGFDEAVTRAQTETRNYAKRQMTWFRHQMPGWPRLTPEEATAYAAAIA